MGNNLVNKDIIVQEFIDQVIKTSTNTIEKNKTSAGMNLNEYTSAQADETFFSGDFCHTADFALSPKDYIIGSALTEQSSPIITRSNKTNTSALADLFLGYAYNLTSIRKATLLVRKTQNGTSLPSVTLWSNQVSALSKHYRLSLSDFKSELQSVSPASLTSLSSTGKNQEAAITNFIGQLNNILTKLRTTLPSVQITTCHSSCHTP